METNKISSGNVVFDQLLEGGIEQDIVTTLYGPAGAGKTCFCMLASLAAVKAGKKVIYIDTEGGFSLERFKQLTPDYENLLEQIMFFKPLSFQEQYDMSQRLRKLVTVKVGLVVVDTISALYRLEAGTHSSIHALNRELSQQVHFLSEIARKRNIPVLITNQVYADFKHKDKTQIVGGDILKNGSKCMVELQSLASSHRKAILRKHRAIVDAKEAVFKIVDTGFTAV